MDLPWQCMCFCFCTFTWPKCMSGAGFTNDFLINTRHPNAIIYNDRSVNENFHVSCAFRLAQLPETNIFEGLSRQEFVQV